MSVKSREGLTVAELVLALSITAMIALSAAGVSMALSTAYAQSQNSYENLQTLRSAMMRIQSELNRAKLIVAVGERTVVYWKDDTNGDGKINLSELATIRYDEPQRRIDKHQVVFPESMDPMTRKALDERVRLWSAMNIPTTVSTIEGSAYHQAQIIAEGVQAFAVDAAPPCPKAKTVTIKISAGDEVKFITIRSAATMRAGRTKDVGVSDNEYTLFPSEY